MNEYHKINSIFKRDPSGKAMLWGQFSLPEFEYLARNEWEFTEKVDGTNVRVMWDGVEVTFGGKTDKAQMPGPLMARLAGRFPASNLAATFDTPACLYGEGYGGRIQKGGDRYGEQQDFVLFDVKIGSRWLPRSMVNDLAVALACPVVPVIGQGTLFDMMDVVEHGLPSTWGGFLAEGIVARPLVEMFGQYGQRIITKFKGRDCATPPQ